MRLFDARSFRLSASLLVFSILVSGCFQTAGAALEATATPQGGAVVTVINPVTEVPPPTAVAAAISPTVTVAPLQFVTAAGPSALPTETQPVATLNLLPPTSLPTETQVVPPTPIQVTPSATLYPSATITPTNTEAAIILPTTAVAIAQVGTAARGNAATQTLEALNAQATGILQTVTAAAAPQQTLVATLQGTGLPPDANQTAPVAATAVPTLSFQASVSGTPQGTPGAAGSGAAGPITGDCKYTVASGDRLFRIALRFNTTPNRIATANGLVNPELIVPDQVLRIPNCNGTPTASGTPFGTGGAIIPATGGGGKTYIVQEGDTLFAIAMRYGTRVMAIAQANGIQNINLIYIGQTLTIP